MNLKSTLNNQINLDFSILGFETDISHGVFMRPWINQFPFRLFPQKIKKLGYKGLAYEFCLYNNKIKIASSSVNPNRWIVKYNCSFDEVRKYEQLLKNLSFEKPENMSGKLLVVELSPITGVKSIHGGTYSQCGVRLNCVHLELTNESWIYIQNDHPIITNKINPEKVRCFYGKNNNKKSTQIYYECEGTYQWIKIPPYLLDITVDKWVNFWGMEDIWNLEERDKNILKGLVSK